MHSIPYEISLPVLMFLLALATLVTNLLLSKKSNERFKRAELRTKADKSFVDAGLKRVSQNVEKSEKRTGMETDLKIRLVSQSNADLKNSIEEILVRIENSTDLKIELLSQAHEENRAMLDHITDRVDNIHAQYVATLKKKINDNP